VQAGALADLALESACGYEAWVADLRAEGAGDVGFRRLGLLTVCVDEKEASELRDGLSTRYAAQRAEWLSAAELRRREPALTERACGAVFCPDVAQVDAPRLTREVARAAERAGVVILEHEPVRHLERQGDRITAVHTAQAVYRPGLVVVTAGCWSGGLASTLGLALPTPPVKGQMLQADCRQSPVTTPLHAGEALFVPQPDGTLKLGVTIEDAGFDDRTTLEGVRTILERTIALVPAVGQLPLARAWAGLRPATPDEWPYMGPVPPLHNLWVSAGHFRKGILLAPICARLLAASILSGHLVDELHPFKPTRQMPG
jgi:glycine oxidase